MGFLLGPAIGETEGGWAPTGAPSYDPGSRSRSSSRRWSISRRGYRISPEGQSTSWNLGRSGSVAFPRSPHGFLPQEQTRSRQKTPGTRYKHERQIMHAKNVFMILINPPCRSAAPSGSVWSLPNTRILPESHFGGWIVIEMFCTVWPPSLSEIVTTASRFFPIDSSGTCHSSVSPRRTIPGGAFVKV